MRNRSLAAGVKENNAMNVYCVGFWGAPNFGDELLASCVFEELRAGHGGEVDIRALVRTADPTPASLVEHGVKPVPGWYPTPEYFRFIRDHLAATRAAKLVCIGGGGLLGDKYSWTTIPRYAIEVLCAISFNKPYCFVGIGVPHVNKRLLRALASFCYRNASAIYCRDRESSDVAVQLGANKKQIMVGPDLAYMYPIDSLRASATSTSVRGPKCTVTNFRENDPLNYTSAAVECQKILKNFPEELVLIATEPSDLPFYARIKTTLSADERARVRVACWYEPRDAFLEIDRCAYALVSRLHLAFALIFFSEAMVKVIPYEQKVRSLVRSIGAQQEGPFLEVSADGKRRRDLYERGREEARSKFNGTLGRALQAPQYRPYVKSVAKFYLITLWTVGAFWVCAVLIKRIIFGRGPLRVTRAGKAGDQ